MTSVLGFIFWLAVFIGGSVYLAYRRMSLPNATAAYAIGLLAYSLFGTGPAWWKILLWLVFIITAVLLNMVDLRRQYLSRPLFEIFRKIMPEMSDTEAAALEAGTVWWDGELFSGCPDWNKLLKTPVPTLSAEEQAFLDGPVQELCGMLDEWKISHEWGDLPPEVWEFLKSNGFFAMIIPKHYGGREFSALANSEVLARIASRSPTCASIVAVPNSLGPAELLLRYGTEEQKDHYLPRLASGEEIPCFALTAPDAGSDAASMTDHGVVCRGEWQGEEIIGMRLNWDKRYITLAPITTVLGLAFRLCDPDHLLGDKEDYGITCALIPPNLPGITIGRRHLPLNIPFQNGPTQGKDVFVPLDFIIGGQKMAGHGWRMLMECLGAGRAISLPSNTTGGSKLAVFTTGAYAQVRRQFNLPIAKFDGIDEVLGRMGGTLYAMDAVRVMTAGAIDLGEAPAVCAAISKYHVTEMARHVTNDAMDIHGGKGIQLGPRNYLGRGYESVPIAITVEGANILTRNLMIYGQGAIRSHPHVLKEMQAAHDEDIEHGLEQFDQLLFSHIGFALSNAARSWFMALLNAKYTHVPVSGGTERYYQHINRFSAAFALASDAAMLTLGGSLKKKEKLSARLGDMLSYMYIASAVLKRFEDQGRPHEDLPLVEWACRDMLYKLQEQMHGFLRNFPNRLVAAVLRFLIFPRGRTYSAPSDRLGHKVAGLITTPGPSRDRLTHGVYAAGKDAVGMMEEALQLAVDCESLQKDIHTARKAGKLHVGPEGDLLKAAKKAGVISSEQANKLERLAMLTHEIISVDDFASDELGTKPLKKSAATKKNTRRKKATPRTKKPRKKPD